MTDIPAGADPVEWAETHANKFTWTAATDRYDPPRGYRTGVGYSYDLAETGRGDGMGVILTDVDGLKEAASAVYLIDTGFSVEAYYVAAHRVEAVHGTGKRKLASLILHPLPTNFNRDGTRKRRVDNGQPVNYSMWMLGPGRFYHLKVAAGTPVTDHLNAFQPEAAGG